MNALDKALLFIERLQFSLRNEEDNNSEKKINEEDNNSEKKINEEDNNSEKSDAVNDCKGD